MAEQPVTTPAKKRTTTKAASTVSGKPAVVSKTKTVKSATATAAKKPAVKKTAAVVTETKQAKAPAVKKVAAATVEKAPAKKTATAKAKPAAAGKSKSKPTPEERYRMVETTAYFIAERHGFQGDSTEHWVAAELEVAAKLGQ